jgi:hypothetical protein
MVGVTNAGSATFTAGGRASAAYETEEAPAKR